VRRTIIAFATLTLVAVAVFVSARFFDFIRLQQCDVPGSPCCNPDGDVNTAHCHKGLGCNITSDQCETCGAPGQPCCDGHYTGFSLRGYTGILLDPSERIESCDAGARCDARLAPDGRNWLGTRTCQACGTKEGGSCCAPDVRYALGRCFSDAENNLRLTCNDAWAREGGTCIPCGRRAGEIACLSGHPCEDGLIEKDGFCVPCGYFGQPPCDRGDPCRGGQIAPNKNYTMCVAAGGPGQPCLPNGGCNYQRMFCNAQKVCEACGEGGKTCCPPSEGTPCTVGECRNGLCFACGYANMPECSTGDRCRDGSEPVNGFCRSCGNEGEPCCFGMSIRCYEGMSCRDRTCRRPPPPPPPGDHAKTCSGQPWIFSTIPRPVWVEDANGCVGYVTYIATTPEEAVQCARAQHGEAVIGAEIEQFAVAVTCANSGCVQRTYPGRDQESAQNCAQAQALGCEVEAGGCP
jgi:hypothetical protein